ncbi:coiled-coil domain-containing protein 138-like [Tubulanus polymorphus]|uniref:coiled-coil domain-containing protein 138-like n=1 Tax=Tubulanus polymorphus TaxID=672921 RepID=UPI003DA519A3
MSYEPINSADSDFDGLVIISEKKEYYSPQEYEQLTDYDAEESTANTTIEPTIIRHSNETLRLFDSADEESPSGRQAPIRAGEESPRRGTVIRTDVEINRLNKMIRRASLESLKSVTEEEEENDDETGADDDEIEAGSDLNTVGVYSELQLIHNQLKEKSLIIHQKELEVAEREKKIALAEARMFTFLEQEIDKTCKVREESLKQQHQQEISNLDELLKSKTKENKRLKDSFDNIKQGNDSLRKQLEDLQVQHEKLEKQSSGLQARLTNLQRIKGAPTKTTKQDADILLEIQKKQSPPKERIQPIKIPKLPQVTYEVMATLLEWISDSNLSLINSEDKTLSPGQQKHVHDKCIKVLPGLVDILRDSPMVNIKICLPSLQFIYWALVHMDKTPTQGTQKSSIYTSTFRRLGEELYRPRSVRFTEVLVDEPVAPPSPRDSIFSPRPPTLKIREGFYFKSNNLHVRFLSCLIILKTLTQADHIAQVFECLRDDLRSEAGKQLFLHYQATTVMLHHFRPVNKILLGYAMDVLLQMSMDSHILPSFLDTCSNETWFRACAMVVRMPNINPKIIEKLSVLLQKLSKIRGNKKLFEIYGITSCIHDVLRNTEAEQTFLALNLKSTLLNLGSRPAMLQ